MLFVAAGVCVGALNAHPIAIDLGVAVLPVTLGVALLVCVLIGAILAGLALSASVILPLRRALRRARAQLAAATPRDTGGH